MSGIPVYTQSPINAAKAGAVTPQTAAPAPSQATRHGPSTNTATTTAVPSSNPYPAAHPGAPAMPAPTSTAQRYVPVQPTSTTKIDNDEPPAPQPGAFPIPPSNMKSNLPPPPKAGERLSSSTSQPAPPQPYPPQMRIPPPNSVFGAQPPSSSTSVATTSTTSYPVALPSGDFDTPRRSLEHPPGYVQNPYASNMSADQRRPQESQNTSDIGSYNSDKSNSTATFGVDTENVWNTAKSWASTAGKKLSEVESEVWKRVNGEK